MKTIIIKLIYSAFAVVILATGTITANGAVNDLFASINGSGDNGGGFIYKYTPSGAQSTFAAGLSRPRGVAFDGFGNLFVASMTCAGTCQGSIVKITPGGVQSTFATLNQLNFQPEGVAFDQGANLFVMAIDLTDPNLASTIFKFTPNGVQSTFGSVPGQGFGLAFDASGNLFAADGLDRIIYKFTPDGARTAFVDQSGFPPNNGPIDLAFDRFGNLFASTESGVVNDASNVIMKFTPTGVGSTFASNLGNYPRGLAFNKGGILFVAEVGEAPNPPLTPGDILKFTPDGTRTVFAVMPSPAVNAGPEWLAFQLRPLH